MPADYTTFQDQPVTLRKNGDLDVDIDFDTEDVDTGRAAYIEFCVIPSGSTTVRLQINGDEIMTQPFDTSSGRVWRENFGGSLLKRHNTLRVAKNADGDDVDVSDFVVHFKTP